MTREAEIAEHWTHGRLAETVLAALAEAGVDARQPTVADLAPLDHLHGRGLDATRELMARLAPAPGSHIVDIGAGLGGPARFAAAEYGCRVAAVDLTAEFCQVAAMLTEITGLSESVAHHCASALALPFADAQFDGAYTQNVSMNVADKAGFYAEAARVLKSGARFVAAECVAGPGGLPLFPVPWAETPATSHLIGEDETRALMAAAGFDVLDLVDTAAAHLRHFEDARRRLAAEGPPVLGAHVVLGASAKEKRRNSARSVEERRVVPIEVVCRRG